VTRVIFFTDTEWSLGRFYIELTKRLWQYDIDCHILSWAKSYNKEEIQEQIATTDLWVSNPNAIQALHINYGVPLEKCAAVIYHTIDIDNIINCGLQIDRLAKLITISPWLQIQCTKLIRQPELAQMGINVNTFKTKPSAELKSIGYGTVFLTREQTNEWLQRGQYEPRAFKRGYLVKEIAEELNLPFKIAETYHTTFMTMPGFYNSVDCIICSSKDEGAGGPVLEAGASGKLVITTKAGDYESYITNKGADGVDVSEKEFKEQTIDLLRYYINNPIAYQKRCAEIQEYALKTYDLSKHVNQWAKLFKD